MMNAARLRRSSDIAAVRAEGRSARETAFSSRSRPNGLDVVRLAVFAPRTVGSAVVRNRARRRVREAFRSALLPVSSPVGLDVLVTARREAITADFATLQRSADSVLRSSGVPR
jgi:ribonuclease P protein component